MILEAKEDCNELTFSWTTASAPVWSIQVEWEVRVWCSCDMLASGDADILHRPVEAAKWLSAALHR